MALWLVEGRPKARAQLITVFVACIVGEWCAEGRRCGNPKLFYSLIKLNSLLAENRHGSDV
ncbi:hypothetical protein KCP76_13910 [Salmonella enterica subsp. enterica serovar Weltevreden]|nr:hypothetical protein KCP76_13910 [Salmonella enterica subsp. enterica serovar Weltevreden]